MYIKWIQFASGTERATYILGNRPHQEDPLAKTRSSVIRAVERWRKVWHYLQKLWDADKGIDAGEWSNIFINDAQELGTFRKSSTPKS